MSVALEGAQMMDDGVVVVTAPPRQPEARRRTSRVSEPRDEQNRHYTPVAQVSTKTPSVGALPRRAVASTRPNHLPLDQGPSSARTSAFV